MKFSLLVIVILKLLVLQRSRTPVVLMMIVMATSAAVNLIRAIIFFPSSLHLTLISAGYIYFSFILYLLLQEFSKGKENSTIITPQYQMDSKNPQFPNQVEGTKLMDTV
jgi:hypothetical protein